MEGDTRMAYTHIDCFSGPGGICTGMHAAGFETKVEGNGFVCVGNANELDAPGAIFSYQSYVREQEAMLPVLIDIFETNTGVK